MGSCQGLLRARLHRSGWLSRSTWPMLALEQMADAAGHHLHPKSPVAATLVNTARL